MRHALLVRLLLAALLAGGATVCPAAVALPAIFADHLVLQQGQPIPVWGWADAGEAVSVRLAGQTLATTADAQGHWRVTFAPLPANATPTTLVVTGSSTLTVSDVLVGEVWLCSGQSNMERELRLWPGQKPIVEWEKERDAADHPLIRQFSVNHDTAATPRERGRGTWTVCSPATVPNFTAVGYFFARDLQLALKVPVAIINVSYGGTPIEAWTSRTALAALPAQQARIAKQDADAAAYDRTLATYRQQEPELLAAWEKAAAEAKASGKPTPRKPQAPARPDTMSSSVASLFNAMVAPLIPYGVRGAAWYQGESNNGNAAQYAELLRCLIADWRARWDAPALPFLIVQIAPFKGMRPELREAQLLAAQTTPATALVVTTDVGDADDIHPARKQPVGARLALAARAIAYGEQLAYAGPTYAALQIHGGTAVISFTHGDGGLQAVGGELRGFTVSADGKTFVPAQARIVGDTVEVTAAGVAAPTAVRYGWANVPDANLANAAGLPASPFRTDHP